MMLFGFVMNLTIVGRVPKEEGGISESSGKGILLYSAMATAAIAAGNFVVPAFFPSILLESYSKLAVLDAQMFGVLIAVSEEQFFRGFLTPYLANRFGLTFGAVTSGLMFGAYHFAVYRNSIEALAIVSLAGIILGYIALKTRRLSPCLLAHALVNFISVGGP